MNNLFKTVALSALIATGMASAAKADITFTNLASGTVRITLECPQSYEKLFVFSSGETKILDCPRAGRAYLRVRTGDSHITSGWVRDGQEVVLYRDNRGVVVARLV